jgi:3-oxoadipate enol-lactonase
MAIDLKTASVNGVEICYADRGAGLPLLLIHGFPLDHTMWAGQIGPPGATTGRGFLPHAARIVAPDLRGFGRSVAHAEKGDSPHLCKAPSGPSGQMGTVPFFRDTVTMEQFADDLAGLLDVLGIVEPVALCGLSMGGYIALQFWRKYGSRLRALILCDTRAAADGPDAAAARYAMADRVLRKGPAPLVETMLPRLFSDRTRRKHPELIDGIRRTMLANRPEAIAAANRGMAQRPNMTAALAEIKCPTLVLVGADDVISTPAEMRGMAWAIPNAAFVEIPSAGHLSPLENPAAVNAAIEEFLSTRL